MNPYVKPSLTRDEVKEFIDSLVQISTVLSWEYYQGLETRRDIGLLTFLETCHE